MKTRLVALMLVCAATAAIGQTFYIDWTKPNPISGPPSTVTLKREGYVRNSTASTKELYFRYNLDEVDAMHTAQLCMSLCWLLYRGEDFPFEREGQILTAGASLPIYVDLSTNGHEAKSTVKLTMFDKTDTTDKLDFEVQFVVSNQTSVRDLADIGIVAGPLPTSDVLTLRGAALQNVTQVGLYDMTGSLIRSYGVPAASGVTYPLTGLSAGTYRMILTLQDGSQSGTAVVVTR